MTRFRSPSRSGAALVAAAVLAAVLAACATDSPGGTDAGVDPALVGSWLAASGTGDGPAGEYGVISFTADTAEIFRDIIAEGGSIHLQLLADGTTAGRLFIPDPAVPDGSNDVDADLGGTWSVTDGVLTMDQEVDTFIRDLPFLVDGDRLVGDHRFGGVHVRVVLVRQGD